jgi:hypothetical protein
MKKLIYFFSILFLSSGSAQTNIYHPFPDSDAVWNVSYLTPWACPFNVDLVESYSYAIDKDTIINNIPYHKIYVPFVLANCANGPHGAGYAGCIRQDTSLRQVYFRSPNDTIERLLYDFRLEAGDTVAGWLVSNWNCFPNVLTVSSVDSILIDSSYRKRWHVANYLMASVATFIEGIGSVEGLLESICPLIDGPIPSLMCFQQNGQSLYPNLNAQCNTIVSAAEPETLFQGHEISLTPNPFEAELTIQFSTQQNEAAHLSIFNCIGEVMVNKEMQLQDQTLNLTLLPQGIYLVTVQTENKIFTEKVIK